MKEEKSILHYIGQVFIIYGFTTICMLCFAFLFGEGAKEYSAFFAFGSEAISTRVLAQFLLLAVLVVLEQFLLDDERMVSFVPRKIRGFLMVLFVLATVILFILIFEWFPLRMWQPWAMFFLCFLVCVAGSMMITNVENKRLSKGLNRLKKQWKEDEKNGE